MTLHCFFFSPSDRQQLIRHKAASRFSAKRPFLKFSSVQDVIDYKNQRWKALDNLDGTIFNKNEYFECESTWPHPIVKHITGRTTEHSFVGSKLYSFAKYIDVPKQLCRFKQGLSVYDQSIVNRNFEPLITRPLLCGNGTEQNVDLLILIKSAFENINRRMAIRKLWADNRCWAGRTIRHVFLLGVSANRSDSWRSKLLKESAHYEDIIQQNFEDHYYNNTYKILFGLQWSVAYCPEAKWLMFVDDDFFINPRRVLAFLDSLDPRLQTRLVAGDLTIKGHVLRARSKWSVNKTLFPYSTYPNFVQAGTFFMGGSMAMDIYIGSRFTEFFPFDDVFIGLVMNKLLIAPVHMQGLLMYHHPNFRLRNKINDSMALHGVRSFARQRWLWNLAQLDPMCKRSAHLDLRFRANAK